MSCAACSAQIASRTALDVPRSVHLARVVGQGVSVDLLIEDLVADLEGRPYGLVIRAEADVGGAGLDLSGFDLAVLAARDLIATGPREPRRGAPYTFVTTETFLTAFGMQSLRDLPDAEQLDDAGL